MRCSILFHLLVPGGKWQTETAIPVSSANLCRATFHSLVLLPLLPPPSAIISNSRAFGYAIDSIVTVQIPMVVDFRGGGGWARAGAGDGNEPQSVNSREAAAAEACRSASR